MTSNGKAELYSAAVGPAKADYYVPIFLRFDDPDGGRASWNWPAFFVTFYWLLYRRMYGIAVLYLFGFPLALVLLAVVAGLMLGEGTATFVYLIGAIAVPWIAMPIFANAMYHSHIRGVIAKLRATAPSEEALIQRLIGRSSGSAAAVVIALVLLFPIAGILAAIAIPAYQDYTIRSQVHEGLNLAGAVKAAVAETYATRQAWPADLQDAGWDDVAASGKYVDSVEIRDGSVLILYGNTAHQAIAGRTLALHPASASNGDITWHCGYSAGELPGTDVPRKYLPAACRGAGP